MQVEISLQETSNSHLEGICEILSGWMRDSSGSLEETNFSFQKDLIVKSLGNPYSKERFLTAIDAHGKIVAIVGYATEIFDVLKSYVRTSKPIQITLLMVSKDKSGHGIGTSVIHEFEALAREKGYEEIILTSSERWKDSWDFYTNKGYKDLGELENTKAFHTKVFGRVLVV